MAYVYLNNEFVEEEPGMIPVHNRSFRYGDGLFETVLLVQRKPVLNDLHIRRLLHSMHVLGIDIPGKWTFSFFTQILTTLAQKNEIRNGRIRITVWREGKGLYAPEENKAGIVITLTEHPHEKYLLNEKGLRIGLFNDIKKMIHPVSACKTTSALLYVMAGRYADQHHFHDVVLLNDREKVAEAISSNIWLVRNHVLYTTIADNGSVPGVMQHFILSHAKKWKYECERIDMTVGEILSADEFFLTNSIQGIRWVEKFDSSTYTKRFTQKLVVMVNKELFG